MIVGSICSGIEAASIAAPDSWEFAFFSEIEKFPSAVLAHHYPDTPNLGDFTKIKADDWPGVELLCGGPPCQSFSVAGNRKGLKDDRGNLTLKYVEMLHEFAANGLVWGLYENVPGILSDKTNAFGCLLSGIVGADDPFTAPNGESWPKQGMASGPRARLAWRVLDAQYFGLAQRRKRVFIVISFDQRRDPAKVLFELKGRERHSAPRREAGQGFTHDVAPNLTASDRTKDIAPTINAAFGDKLGLDNQHIDGGAGMFVCSEVCPAITTGPPFSRTGNARVEAEALVAFCVDEIPPIAFSSKDYGQDAISNISPTLRAGSCDKSHANGGVPPAVVVMRTDQTGQNGSGISYDELAGTLDGAGGQAVAMQSVAFAQNTRNEVRVQGGDGEICGALSANEGMKQRTYIAQPAKVFSIRGHHQVKELETVCDTITSAYGEGGGHIPINLTGMSVRRLLPEECEVLQGFSMGFTCIPYRGKPANECPDGHRYKALGNSWAVPVVAWIFSRIEEQENQIIQNADLLECGQ